jgi:hypothetical protein
MRQLTPKLALCVGSLLLSALLSEGLMRWFVGRPAPAPGHHRLFMEYDALLGWRKIANSTGQHVTAEYAVTERINARGLRGPDYPYAKARDEYRILILGDSFAEGYTVEFDDLCSEVLKRQLNGRGGRRRYEVINAGSGGYSTDQELLFFVHEGQRYQPDLTVLLFYDNDVWFNQQPTYWRGHKPRFQLAADGTLTLTNLPVPRPEPPAAPGLWRHPLDAAHRWLSAHSSAYRFVQDRLAGTAWLQRWAMALGRASAPSAPSTPLAAVPIPDEFRVYRRQSDADVAAAWRLTEALLQQLGRETAAAGSAWLIFYVPVRASIYLDEWTAIKQQYGIADDGWSIEQVGRELMAICRRHGFDCIDPVAAFRAEASRLRATGERLYFVEDGHWTAVGHRVAGELLAHHIAQSYVADAPRSAPPSAHR